DNDQMKTQIDDNFDGIELKDDDVIDEDINKKIVEEKNTLQNKYDNLYERFVRLAADFDNYKKRLTKEKSDVLNYGNEELIRGLLNVLDNLERALVHAEKSDDGKSLIEGVKLVYDQFLSCLEKFNVTVVESGEGVEFNPKFHEAIERVESDKYENGIIISEMVKGYRLKDRLIRPSMVSVSKGISLNINIKSPEKEPELKMDSNTKLYSDIDFDSNAPDMIDIIDLTRETNS
ncbi:MAG: nucleotide exchange factor GrpE, partial [Thermodesulfobacteriota bacterium]